MRIADQLSATAVSHDDRCLWLGDDLTRDDGAWAVVHRDCDGSLYAGTAGIGWFLAQVAALDQAEVDRERIAVTARGALAHALGWLERGEHSIGLYTGACGVGWAVVEAAAVLGDEQLAAKGFATLVTAMARARHVTMAAELLDGRAGLITAALAGAYRARQLGAARSVDLLRAEAIRHGRILLDEALVTPTGWVWNDEDTALCGAAHGVSGIVLACAELSAATGDPAFAEAVVEGSRWERAWRNGDGWPDLRREAEIDDHSPANPPRPALWCHGAIGIGLVRLRAWAALREPAILADVHVSLEASRRAVGHLLNADPNDYVANMSLCHGWSGIVQLLCEAAETFDEVAWRVEAAGVLALADQRRAAGFDWPPGTVGARDVPGLMLGQAGAGAAMLRLSDPLKSLNPLLPVPRAAPST